MTASRIFNYSHFLSGFKYTIEYLSTTTHGNADFLSRFPITEISENNDYDDHDKFMIHQVEMMPVTRNQIKIYTEQYGELQQILQYKLRVKKLK